MHNELILPGTKPAKLKSVGGLAKMGSVNEAMRFASGTKEEKIFTTRYTSGDYSINLGKPGKEFFRDDLKYKDGYKSNNPHDMFPVIFKNNHIFQKEGSFEAIFRYFVKLHYAREATVLLGCLFVRNAYCLDHRLNNGKWEYCPPLSVISEMEKGFKAIDLEEPIDVFLHYIEAIALNEDVKYTTLGFDIMSGGTGRENNLLTYAHLLSVLLQKEEVGEVEFLLSFMKFAGGLTRIPIGVNPLPLSKALKFFPFLT